MVSTPAYHAELKRRAETVLADARVTGYSALSAEEREDLRQQRLAAAPHGGEAMLAVLETWLLDRAVCTILDES